MNMKRENFYREDIERLFPTLEIIHIEDSTFEMYETCTWILGLAQKFGFTKDVNKKLKQETGQPGGTDSRGQLIDYTFSFSEHEREMMVAINPNSKEDFLIFRFR